MSEPGVTLRVAKGRGTMRCACTIYTDWWADIAPRRPTKTARTYRYHVLRFAADLGCLDPRNMAVAKIRDYMDTISNQHAEAVRSALADFFDFCVRHGLADTNPLLEIRRTPSARRRIRRGLDDEELARVLVAACYLGHSRFRWDPGGQRLAWIILALANTGIRPGELLMLTTQQVHLRDPYPWVLVYASKTDSERAIPLNAKAREAFRELCRDRVGRLVPWGTTQLGSKIRRAAIAAGLPDAKCRAYALRHTFATMLIERGAPARIVAELLGHTDLRHMAGYTQPGDRQLREVVDLL